MLAPSSQSRQVKDCIFQALPLGPLSTSELFDRLTNAATYLTYVKSVWSKRISAGHAF
jgi:hypothetical protein